MNKRCKAIYAVGADILLGRIPTKEEIVAKEAEFQAIWDGSGQTDYSFYGRDDYAFLALNSWTVRSWSDIEWGIKHGIIRAPKRVFDYCGGIGMSTALLAMEYPGSQVYTHNIAPKQCDAARELAKRLGLKNMHVTDELAANCDLFLAQECFEHIKDPFTDVKRVMDIVKPKQYLDASSFTLISPGHHDVFTDGEVPVPRKKAKRLFNKLLRGRGYLPYWESRPDCKKPFNGHPAIWEFPA